MLGGMKMTKLTDMRQLMYNLGDKMELVYADKKADGKWIIAIKTDEEVLEVMRSIGGFDKSDFFRILKCGRNEEEGTVCAEIVRVIDEENQNTEGQ